MYTVRRIHFALGIFIPAVSSQGKKSNFPMVIRSFCLPKVYYDAAAVGDGMEWKESMCPIGSK